MNSNTISISLVRPKTSILDRSLSKGRGEVSSNCFALLFSEVVQYCQSRVYTVPELQNKNTIREEQFKHVHIKQCTFTFCPWLLAASKCFASLVAGKLSCEAMASVGLLYIAWRCYLAGLASSSALGHGLSTSFIVGKLTILAQMGQEVGVKLLDLYFVREKNCKRETKLLNMLLFIKTTLWKGLFGREADKLEHANDDERIYYIIEKEPVVNKFISVPKDKGNLNCAVFIAGIVEAVLNSSGFNAKVTAHWHKGTTYMVQFDEAVIARDKQMEER